MSSEGGSGELQRKKLEGTWEQSSMITRSALIIILNGLWGGGWRKAS